MRNKVSIASVIIIVVIILSFLLLSNVRPVVQNIVFLLYVNYKPVLTHSSPAEDIALAPARINGKWGYIDKNAKVVIPARFDDAKEFAEGLARVGIIAWYSKTPDNVIVEMGDGWDAHYKYGYIDKAGNVVIPLKYNFATDAFCDGLAFVRDKMDETIYINKNGKEIIPGNNPGLRYRGQGLFSVKVDDKYGYVDKSVTTVIQPQFEKIGDNFSEGLTAAKINGKWGYIDETGKFAVPPILSFQNDIPIGQFNEGLARFQNIGGRFGYIDKSGQVVIPAQYFYAWDFRDGLSMVSQGTFRPNDRKVGFINKEGELVIPFTFQDDQYSFMRKGFSEGLAAVKVNYKWGYIDKAGKFVIPPQFDRAADFNNGLARVEINFRSGYIDKQGKIVIPLQYSSAGDFK